MTKGFMRGISFGIILTCLLLFFLDNPFSEKNTSTEEKEAPITNATLNAALKEKGQTAISIDEYNRLKQLEQQSVVVKEETKKEEEKTEQPKDEDTSFSYTLEVKSGMSSTDISNKLAEVKVINNADDLEKYLQEKDWARKIQIGTFEVNNKMAIDEIARIITKQ